MAITAGSTALASDFVSTSAGAGDSGKVPKLASDGKIDISMIKGGVFGGTGTDGALTLTSGATNIDLGGAQVVVKNYTSISITGTGYLTFTNPHANGTNIILKSRGNVTITSSATRAIDLRSIGGIGGTGGSNGASGSGGASIINNGTNGNGTSATAPASDVYTLNDLTITKPTTTVAGVRALRSISIYTKKVEIGCGTGGSGGRGNTTNVKGGDGGGALYLECAGAYNVSGTIDASGGACVAVEGIRESGGGGGGSIVVFYNTLTSNTGTYNVAGGASGGLSGGVGGAGYSLIGLNTEFV